MSENSSLFYGAPGRAHRLGRLISRAISRKVSVVNFISFWYTFFIMQNNLLAKIIGYNDNLTIRVKLVALTVAGLAVTMAVWGVIQLTALDSILVDLQVKRLSGVAETVSTFYQHFPTRRGIATLDSALKLCLIHI